MRRFEGKLALVTGAASGIGAACASAFAAEGARVALFDRDAGGVASMAASLSLASAFVVDVADKRSVNSGFEQLLASFGALDILVNNAGVESTRTIESMPEEDWDRVLDVNLKGAMLCTQAAVPVLRARGGGAIVNIASIAGKRISYHGGASYTASKGGLLALTRHAAFELAIDRIRVNAVCPGPTLTPMIRRNSDDESIRRTLKMVPLGRWVMPEDIAQSVLFLASNGAAMCTGTSLDVDGGVLVSNGSSYEEYFARRH